MLSFEQLTGALRVSLVFESRCVCLDVCVVRYRQLLIIDLRNAQRVTGYANPIPACDSVAKLTVAMTVLSSLDSTTQIIGNVTGQLSCFLCQLLVTGRVLIIKPDVMGAGDVV
jgi:hypothetical protein